MIGWVLKALLAGVSLCVLLAVLRARYVFEIRIQDGQPRIRRGKVPLAFLTHMGAVCRDGGVTRGWIGGVRRGSRTALQFSREFSPGLRQRVRNAWEMST
jgi:hypothetical protein